MTELHGKMLQVTQIDPAELLPNPWNTNVVDPDDMQRLKNSLDRLGVFKPILCREVDDGLEILGGEHRALAAAEQGYETVPVINLGTLDDSKAKEISIVDNSRYGDDDAIRFAELLDELGHDVDLSSFLPYDEAEMESILSSVHISLDDLEMEDDDEPDPELSRPPKTHQIMRFKVPLEDAEQISDLIEQIQDENGFNESDQLTNAGDALIHLLKSKSGVTK